VAPEPQCWVSGQGWERKEEVGRPTRMGKGRVQHRVPCRTQHFRGGGAAGGGNPSLMMSWQQGASLRVQS